MNAVAPLPVPVSSITLADLIARVELLGHQAFRARQIDHAVWRAGAATFEEIHELPATLREQLTRQLSFSAVEGVAQSEADDGDTVKLLCRLHDGQTVETVAMETPATARARRRSTVCVSSQVGCAVGCPFCATGQMGLRRHCSAAEIVDQVRLARRTLHARGRGPVTHVVYMGMGEPLANYGSTSASIGLLVERWGLSPRRITVSTSGVVPGIDRLADEPWSVTLAVSLHAATDELRDRLVPINRAHPLDSVIAAAQRYRRVTGRRLTLEWCLIGGINDGLDQADRLAAIARELSAHVNVIPMNHVDGSPWGPPDPVSTRAFLSRLGPLVTVRDTRGADTDAACGQLRAGLDRRRTVMPDGSLGRPRPRPG